MKKYSQYLSIISFVAFILISCNQKPQPVLSFSNLKSEYFELNIENDTTLVTDEGLRFMIPRNSIRANSKICKIEVRAALKLSDMLKAGLTTTSDRKLLSSDGMFYFNVVDDNTAKIVKPIEVGIPIHNYSPNMALFKGVDDSGKLEWTQPKPLPSTPYTIRIANGERLYMENCANCHKIESDFTGPELSRSVSDVDRDYFREWVRNPLSNFYIGDSDSTRIRNAIRAACVKRKWRPTLMTAFVALSDSSIEDIRYYIKSQIKGSEKYSTDVSSDICYDSCLDAFRNQILNFSDTSVIVNVNNSVINNNTVINNDTFGYYETEVDVGKVDSLPKYEFLISSFGWYNLDYFLKREEGCIPSDIEISNSSRLEQIKNVYIVIPKFNVVASLVLDDSNGKLSFYGDTLMLLPQGHQATLLLYTENEDGTITFGVEKLVIQRHNRIGVDIVNGSSSDFLDLLDQISGKPKQSNTKKFDRLSSRDTTIDVKVDSNIQCCPCDLIYSSL